MGYPDNLWTKKTVHKLSALFPAKGFSLCFDIRDDFPGELFGVDDDIHRGTEELLRIVLEEVHDIV